MGSTGASTGVHLHFEIRRYDNAAGDYIPVNPVPILNSYGIGF
jgi:murein DD-endopeptidase MepM/ murein hydrolase activator NlpD